MNRPIYELFGGPVWDDVPMYTHVAPGDPDRAAAQARELADEGFTALKTDPLHAGGEAAPSPLHEG